MSVRLYDSVTDLNDLYRNESLKNICTCKSKQCILRVSFVGRDQAVSSARKRFCGCIVPAAVSFMFTVIPRILSI